MLSNSLKLKPLGIIAQSDNLDKTAEYWSKFLRFKIDSQQKDYIIMSNGNIVVYVKSRETPVTPTKSGYVGLEHLALNSTDIETDIRYGETNELNLNTNSGSAYFNPKVWGKGTYYINFRDNAGAIIEFCQRLDQQGIDGSFFSGLSHIGILSSCYENSISFYKKLGFSLKNEVRNYNPTEGNIYCAIMELDDTSLEIYEFVDFPEFYATSDSFFFGLLFNCDDLEATRDAIMDKFTLVTEIKQKNGVSFFQISAPDKVKIIITTLETSSNSIDDQS